MVNFFTFAFVATALSGASAKNLITTTAGSVLLPQLEIIDQPLQTATDLLSNKRDASPAFDKRGLLDLPTSIISQVLSGPSRTPSQSAPQLVSGRVSFKLTRVHAYLLDTLNAILPHTHAIRRLCAGAESQDPQRLSWEIVTELRAILEILNRCLYKVKNCGKAPSPSGIPGGKPICLDDICQLFFKIMCEIRECCKRIGALCIKYKVVRSVCQDTLVQITGCLSSIAIRCGVEVGDVFTGLGRLFATVPNFFVGIQFGFSAIPGVLANSNVSFSLGVSI